MNETVYEFLSKNNMMNLSQVISTQIYNINDINPIIANFALYDNPTTLIVSVANIVGYDYNNYKSNDLILNLSNFFDQDGKKYQTRSIDMLKYSSDEIMSKLKLTFVNEPMKLVEVNKGMYLVSGNGLHRYSILRLYYLNEYEKVKNDPNKVEELYKKYSFIAEVSSINKIKTYCKFILKRIPKTSESMLISEQKNNCEIIGNSILLSRSGEKKFSDIELIDYVNQSLKNTDVSELSMLNFYLKTNDDFNLFVNENFPDFILKLNGERKK